MRHFISLQYLRTLFYMRQKQGPIRDTSKTYLRIVDTSKTFERIDPGEAAKSLGAKKE